jgi:hypothetical protein
MRFNENALTLAVVAELAVVSGMVVNGHRAQQNELMMYKEQVFVLQQRVTDRARSMPTPDMHDLKEMADGFSNFVGGREH